MDASPAGSPQIKTHRTWSFTTANLNFQNLKSIKKEWFYENIVLCFVARSSFQNLCHFFDIIFVATHSKLFFASIICSTNFKISRKLMISKFMWVIKIFKSFFQYVLYVIFPSFHGHLQNWQKPSYHSILFTTTSSSSSSFHKSWLCEIKIQNW